MLAAARFIITLAKPPPKNLISRKTFWTGFPGFRTSTGTCLAAFALAFSCLSSIALHAQAAPVPFDGIALDVSLVTASPGRGWAEWLGHTGILVGNPDIGEQRFYEFGGFSFDRATVWAAVSGNMTASAREEPAATAMARFTKAGRKVDVQRLALSQGQKLDLLRRLDDAVRPGNNRDRYRIVTSNCATRPRDVLDIVTGGSLSEAGIRTSPTTLRENVLALPMPAIVKLLMDFTFNGDVDRTATAWVAAALPAKLEELAAVASVRDDAGIIRPLVMDSWSFGEGPKVSAHPTSGLGLFATGIMIAVLALITFPSGSDNRARAVAGWNNVAFGAALGIPGAFLLIGWLFTGHDFLYRNANLFLANPILIAAIPLGIAHMRGREWAPGWMARVWFAAAVLALLGLCIALFFTRGQDNLRFYGLILPMLLSQASMALRRQSPRVWSVRAWRTPAHFTSNDGVSDGTDGTDGNRSRAVA